eukprot:360740-Chlamydomonas_euryale.AAC.3
MTAEAATMPTKGHGLGADPVAVDDIEPSFNAASQASGIQSSPSAEPGLELPDGPESRPSRGKMLWCALGLAAPRRDLKRDADGQIHTQSSRAIERRCARGRSDTWRPSLGSGQRRRSHSLQHMHLRGGLVVSRPRLPRDPHVPASAPRPFAGGRPARRCPRRRRCPTRSPRCAISTKLIASPRRSSKRYAGLVGHWPDWGLKEAGMGRRSKEGQTRCLLLSSRSSAQGLMNMHVAC